MVLTPQGKQFASVQEGCRKDVEKAFGILPAKWHILAGVGRSWKVKYMKNIWTTCFILHNMTLRDQQMNDAKFLAEEEARNQVVGGLFLLAPPPIPQKTTLRLLIPKMTMKPQVQIQKTSIPQPRPKRQTRIRRTTRWIMRRVLTGGSVLSKLESRAGILRVSWPQ